MAELFGTDGVRGIVGRELGCSLAMNIAKVTVKLFGRGSYALGRDTRISSDMLSSAFMAGLCSMGAQVCDLGVLPTPALSFYIKSGEFRGGAMISASHNSFEYNGIKLFDSEGEKLDVANEEAIEALLFQASYWKELEDCGTVDFCAKPSMEYVNRVIKYCDEDISNLRIVVDAANGATFETAHYLFNGVGCCAEIINDAPNGKNINHNCGSTSLNSLSERVRAGEYDCAIALDGDGDRCIFTDEKGERVDGDRIIALCAEDMKQRGRLHNNRIVMTEMADRGVMEYCREKGIEISLSRVGDKNVADAMKAEGVVLGGENSGHIIFGECAPHGDGLLTAIKLLCVMKRRGRSLSELTRGIPRYVRIEKNISASTDVKQAFLQNNALSDYIKQMNRGSAHLLVRPSGTENCLRLLVQARDEKSAQELVRKAQDKIKRELEL